MSRDPFDILGVPPRLDLSRAEIDRAYRRRVATLHPDLALGADPDAAAAQLNESRETLLDAERRANALLARLGGPGPEDRSLPPGFLAQIMARREALDEALANDAGAITAERERALAERAETVRALTPLFEQAATSPDSGLLRDLRCRLNAWRYLERLIEQTLATSD